MKHSMLHMKLNSAVSVIAVAAACSVLLPSSAYCGVCFLPDCQDSDTMHGDINMNVNNDTEWCEKKGFTYYSSGKCPQYYSEIGKCSRDDYYLKCDPVKWCKDNGYNTTSCSLPSYVNDQCPNKQAYYKGCKEDRPRACQDTGYVNSCSSGRLYATTNRCQWDRSYGKCCTASPSAGCPSSYAVNCDPARGSSGTDTCGYTCYRCCSDDCSRGSKYYTGSYAGTTECGSTCRYCKNCTSGSTSYSGSYAGSSECGSCYYCSDTCRSGSKSVSCSSTYKSVRVSSTECGTGCYECRYNTDCSVTSKSCSYGCASYNSCSKCTSCKTCSPLANQTGCTNGTESCSDGCGGTRTCCKANPWVRYKRYSSGDGSWCVEKANIVCKSDGRYCLKDGEYSQACPMEYGCYNKETGEYRKSGRADHAFVWHGAPVYTSRAACNAAKISCDTSTAASYGGYSLGILNWACSSDGTVSDPWF